MITRAGRTTGFAAAVILAALAFIAGVSAPTPAKARVFVGFSFGVPIGFPFLFPPYPYPYFPSPAYYPPPPYYPAPASYPPPAPSYQPSAAYAPAGPSATPSITYTPRRGWTNAQGEYCREYKTSQGPGSRATERYGTACRDPSGRWRIVN
jgi:hypothetical protein